MIAAARLDRPALMIYGGTIKPGSSMAGEPLDIVSAFQSYGTLFSCFPPFFFLLSFLSFSFHTTKKAPSLVKQSAFCRASKGGGTFRLLRWGGWSEQNGVRASSCSFSPPLRDRGTLKRVLLSFFTHFFYSHGRGLPHGAETKMKGEDGGLRRFFLSDSASS